MNKTNELVLAAILMASTATLAIGQTEAPDAPIGTEATPLPGEDAPVGSDTMPGTDMTPDMAD